MQTFIENNTNVEYELILCLFRYVTRNWW